MNDFVAEIVSKIITKGVAELLSKNKRTPSQLIKSLEARIIRTDLILNNDDLKKGRRRRLEKKMKDARADIKTLKKYL